MKKLLSAITSVIILLSLIIFPSNAATDTFSSVSVIYYDDGSYMTIYAPIFTVSEATRSSTKTITATMPATYSDSSGALEWEYTLTATFSYVYGVSATCTNADYSYTIYNDLWKFSDGSTSRSGATAYGYGTFKNKFLFITTKTVEIDLSMTCDVYGNLS